MSREITEKILQVLRCDADEQTLREVNQYIGASEANRREFEQTKMLFSQREVILASSKEGMASFKEKFHSRLEQSEALKHRTGQVRWLSVVASALVLLSLSLGYALYRSNDRGEPAFSNIATGKGENSTLMLPDGTKVALHSDSRISYALDYGQKTRNIRLSGSAYFDVSSDAQKPFTVTMNGASIVVKGTKFNVDAYEDSQEIATRLIEGSVEILTADATLEMMPGEEVVINRAMGTFTRSTFDTEYYRRWLDGKVEYEDVTIAELCTYLEKIYAVTIKLDEDLKNSRRTMSLRLANREPIQTVFSAVSLIVPISIENVDGRQYLIKNAHK